MAVPSELTPGQLKILKAVATLMEEPSVKITIHRIANEIHVTDGAIYRHYRSKEEIFESIANYMESNLLSPLNAVQKQGTDTHRRLETVFDTYMEFLEGHPGLARLLLGHSVTEAPGLPERVRLINAKIRSQVAQMLKFGQAQGMLQQGITPEQGAEIFYGLVMAAAMTQAFNIPYMPLATRWDAFSKLVLKPNPASLSA